MLLIVLVVILYRETILTIGTLLHVNYSQGFKLPYRRRFIFFLSLNNSNANLTQPYAGFSPAHEHKYKQNQDAKLIMQQGWYRLPA